MKYQRDLFYKAVRETVENIPAGAVMGYASVARYSGYPRHSRFVSRVLKHYGDRIPWHRVIRSDGTSAFARNTESYRQQKQLLEAEGVRCINGRFIPAINLYPCNSIDQLLWSPEP